MKKILIIIALFTTVFQLTKASVLAPSGNKTTILTDTLKRDGIDPVCKMKVKAGNTKTVVFEKITYGFCSQSCKNTFNKTPGKYVIKKKSN